MLVVTIFDSDENFGLIDIGYVGLEGKTTVGREWSDVIPTIRGISSRGFNLLCLCGFPDDIVSIWRRMVRDSNQAVLESTSTLM
jgi:hypothetical protein